MKFRNLGKHGLKVSEISIGTMYYGSHISKKQGKICLEEAVNQGINYIDCADRYGVFDSELPMDQRLPAEEVIGEFIQKQNRDDLVLSTKVFYKMRDSANSGGLSRKHIREAINRSLKLMKTDYVDIYYCHRPDRDTPLAETIMTMTNLIDEGKINYWGTSWWPPTLVERTIWLAKKIGGYAPHVEQPPYHMRARFIEADLLEVAKTHGLGLVTFEALATGLLTEKYMKGIPEGTRATLMDQYTPEVMEIYANIVKELKKIADKLNITVAQLALAWSLRLPEISSSLTGASKPEYIKENVKASDVELSADILEKIEEILDNKPKTSYR
ncbi:MAG: aldo/keto reductase [Asgard group archaeon]|nr:aldo/keto reductase [Asgard group archaeon]